MSSATSFQGFPETHIKPVASGSIRYFLKGGQFSYSWGDHRSWQERSPVRLPRKVQGLNGMDTRGRQKSTRTNFDRIVEGVSWQLYLALFLLEWLISDKSYVRKNGFMAHGARMQVTRGCSPPSRGREAAGV